MNWMDGLTIEQIERVRARQEEIREHYDVKIRFLERRIKLLEDALKPKSPVQNVCFGADLSV